MFDPGSFLRVAVFGAIYAGIEYKYVNRYEHDWPKTAEGVLERPVFWVITPYHLFLLLPLFVTVSFTVSITAWAGNTIFLAVLEDVVYFVWRGRSVTAEDWTTTLFGSFKLGRFVIPAWWPLDILLAVVLFWVPL